MPLLIIVLAVTLIIGSMMWILPSPREKVQMRLRKAAQANGLRVQLTKLKVKGVQEPINCAAYSLSWGRSGKAKNLWKYYNKKADYIDVQSVWQSGTDNLSYPLREPLNSIELDYLEGTLSGLPDGWLAAEQRSDATVLYWQERGEEESVAEIVGVLQTLQNL